MRTGKLGKLNIFTLIVLTIAVVCLVTSATFALTQLTAQQNFEMQSATNFFSLENSGEYYKAYSLSEAQTTQTVTVYNNIVNPTYTNPSFDLLVFTDDDTTVTLAGSTPEIKDSDNGKCYVFKEVAHTSQTTTGSMDVTLNISGANAEENLKTAVLASSDNNVYVSSFFELQLANNEMYYDTYHEQSYGSWTTAASGTYMLNGSNITIGEIGTFAFSDTNSTADSLTGTLIDGTLTLDFDSLTMENGLTVAGSNKFVFNLEDDKYVNSAYGIRITLDAGIITVEYLPYTNFDIYKNIFFINSIITDSMFTLNIPCKINLLYSQLILGADMEISHHYGGSFSITAIPSATEPIDNTNHTLTINCPRAYYYTGLDDGSAYGGLALVSSAENLIKFSDCVDFSAAENADLLTALIDDAKNYLTGYIQGYVWSDFILPHNYQNYGITYAYSTNNNALDSMGNVTRGTDSTTLQITVEIAFGGTIMDTVHKDILVVGTSESAKMNALADMLQIHIEKSTLLSDGINVLDRNVELLNLIKVLMSREGGLDISERFRLDGGVLPFVLQYTEGEAILSYEAFSVEFNPEIGTVTLMNGDETVASRPLASLTSLYLENPTFVINGGRNDITVSYAYNTGAYTQTATVSVFLKEMTFAERTAYIERYIETLYLTGSNVPFDILQVTDDGMYRGTVAGGNKVLDSTLGATGMSYNIYQMSDEDHADYHAGLKTLDELTSKEDKTDLFTLQDGQIYVGAISAPPNQALVMIITITFNSEIAAEQSYTTHREIILPASGIGGTDYTQYTGGNTFGEYFDSLTGGKLIDSTADSGDTQGTGYEFKTFESGVSLEMTIVNNDAVLSDSGAPFCTLVYNSTGRFYQIDINTDSIPARNTTVQLLVRFYIESAQGAQTDISTQNYSFIIPGIYKQGRDVASPAIYARMLEVYENYNGTLLVDGARSEVAVFDCSIATLTNVSAEDIVSLKGVELLSNTASMIFDGIRIESLAPFSAFDTHVLTALSMKGCCLTDEIITAQTDGVANLYHLNRLTSINLDNNAITTLLGNGSPYLYRTVTTLSIAEQRNGGTRCLHSIDGIATLVGLQALDISGNGIASFEALTDCESLLSVILDDNIASEFSRKNTTDTNIYYGSSGKTNIPVFVTLTDRGISVTGDSVTLFTENERICALALNAISTFKTQYGGIIFPSLTYVTSTGNTNSYTITVNYLVSNENAISFSTAVVDDERNKLTAVLTNGDTVLLIASITVNETTVYRQFTFTYREVTE